MSTAKYDNPTLVALTLRALRRFPERTAFAWDEGALSYRATASLIAGLQAGMAAAGLRRGMRLALLAGNRAQAWCAGVAAQGLGLSITWLHPMASLSDHIYHIQDSEADGLIVDQPTYRDRGGELAARGGVAIVLTLGRAEYGTDLLAAAERAGEADPQDLSSADDCAILNYTGGTTGKSKGVVRRHRSYAQIPLAILADYDLPQTPRYLAAAPITQSLPTTRVPVRSQSRRYSDFESCIRPVTGWRSGVSSVSA